MYLFFQYIIFIVFKFHLAPFPNIIFFYRKYIYGSFLKDKIIVLF